VPCSTRASFHARFSASSRPEFAPRAPNGEHLMRGIAGEDDAIMDEFFHAAGTGNLYSDIQTNSNLSMTQQSARSAAARFSGEFFPPPGPASGTELQIDPPDIVGLAVQQRGASGVKRRIEPEPALGRKFRRHLDVGDQKTGPRTAVRWKSAPTRAPQ